jgi:hypothetical protein
VRYAPLVRSAIVLLLLGLCLPGVGQAGLRFGVSAEVNRASFGGIEPEDADYGSNYGTGFAGIVESRVHRDLVLSFQPGWIQKGSKIIFNEDEDPDSVQTFVVEQSWVTLPVYFRVDSDDRGVYAGGGLSVDLLLDSELEYEGTTRDNTEVFEDVDFVYQFTVGYMRDGWGRTLFLEGRYMQGMSTITDDEGAAEEVEVAGVKSNGLRLVAGVLF